MRRYFAANCSHENESFYIYSDSFCSSKCSQTSWILLKSVIDKSVVDKTNATFKFVLCHASEFQIAIEILFKRDNKFLFRQSPRKTIQ